VTPVGAAEDTLVHSALQRWVHAHGTARATLWQGHVLPRLDAAFRVGHDTPLDLWEHATAEEVATLFAPNALATTLARTDRFPFDPHWIDRDAWDTCAAAAHGFAAHAPWNQAPAQDGGWTGTEDDAARVCTAILRDAQAPHDSAARFLRRVLEHGLPMEPICGTLEMALMDAVGSGNGAALGPILAMEEAEPILHALFPAQPVQALSYNAYALPLFLACWERGMHHIDQGRSVWVESRVLPLHGLSAHRKVQAIAWARAHGWPLHTTPDACKALARSLVDGAPL